MSMRAKVAFGFRLCGISFLSGFFSFSVREAVTSQYDRGNGV